MAKKSDANVMVGMAMISRTTKRLDKLCKLPTIAAKTVVQTVIQEVKSEILAGLAEIQGGLKDR